MVDNEEKYFCLNCDKFLKENEVDVFQHGGGIITFHRKKLSDDISINSISNEVSFKCLICNKKNTNYYCSLESCFKCPNPSKNDRSKDKLLRVCDFNNNSKKRDFSSVSEHDYLSNCEECGTQKISREMKYFKIGSSDWKWGCDNCYQKLKEGRGSKKKPYDSLLKTYDDCRKNGTNFTCKHRTTPQNTPCSTCREDYKNYEKQSRGHMFVWNAGPGWGEKKHDCGANINTYYWVEGDDIDNGDIVVKENWEDKHICYSNSEESEIQQEITEIKNLIIRNEWIPKFHNSCVVGKGENKDDPNLLFVAYKWYLWTKKALEERIEELKLRLTPCSFCKKPIGRNTYTITDSKFICFNCSGLESQCSKCGKKGLVSYTTFEDKEHEGKKYCEICKVEINKILCDRANNNPNHYRPSNPNDDEDRKSNPHEVCEKCGTSCWVGNLIKKKRYVSYFTDFTTRNTVWFGTKCDCAREFREANQQTCPQCKKREFPHMKRGWLLDYEIKKAFCSPDCHVKYRNLDWEQTQNLTQVEMMPPELDIDFSPKQNTNLEQEGLRKEVLFLRDCVKELERQLEESKKKSPNQRNPNEIPHQQRQISYLLRLHQNTQQKVEKDYESKYGKLESESSDNKNKGISGGVIALIIGGVSALIILVIILLRKRKKKIKPKKTK